MITIDYETDDSDDVDDLYEVSMMSAGGITKEEYQGMLGDIAATHLLLECVTFLQDKWRRWQWQSLQS